jgi:hypothetical protein
VFFELLGDRVSFYFRVGSELSARSPSVTDESPHFRQYGKNPTSGAFTPDRYFGDGGGGADLQQEAKDFEAQQSGRCGSALPDEL